MELFVVQIVAFKGDEVVKEMGPKSQRECDRIQRGADINLNHEEYFTRIVKENSILRKETVQS